MLEWASSIALSILIHVCILILAYLNALLVVSRWIVGALAYAPTLAMGIRKVIDDSDDEQKKKPVVAIIGGSFAGLACARALSQDCDVILIDKKKYFEYSPGVLRLLVNPKLFPTLTAPLDAIKGVRFVEGTACGLQDWRVKVRYGGDEDQLVCDAAIIATGSVYTGVIKAGEGESDLSSREVAWEEAAAKLRAARNVLVIGGGPVGVELVGEIAYAFPKKKIVLVNSSTALCSPFAHPESSKHIQKWLRKRPNVEVVLGDRCQKVMQGDDGSCVYKLCKKGRLISADIVYECTGSKPDTGMLRSALGYAMDSVGGIRCEPTLQVQGTQRVFALGDAMTLEGSQHPKLGHTAELQAKTVCENVLRINDGRLLCTYPAQAEAECNMYAISLGPTDATLRFGPIVLHGFLAAFLKWGIEWSKIAQVRQIPIGVLLWDIADRICAVTVDRALQPVFPDESKHNKLR